MRIIELQVGDLIRFPGCYILITKITSNEGDVPKGSRVKPGNVMLKIQGLNIFDDGHTRLFESNLIADHNLASDVDALYVVADGKIIWRVGAEE